MDSKEKRSQKTRAFECFKTPKTRLQVAFELNILRGNVCYYVDDFRRLETIAVVKKDRDPLTGHKAEYLTTDTALFPEDNQTRLFD